MITNMVDFFPDTEASSPRKKTRCSHTISMDMKLSCTQYNKAHFGSLTFF